MWNECAKLPKGKEEDIVVDACTCGKSRSLMTMKEYFSWDTTDAKLKGSMRDYGLAWVKLLNGYILEIDSINNTIPYRRSATSIALNTPLTNEQKGRRRKRLETLACCHPGLYKAIRIIAEEENIEPIEIPLKRVDSRREKKKLDGLQREKERKLRDIERLDEEIKTNKKHKAEN